MGSFLSQGGTPTSVTPRIQVGKPPRFHNRTPQPTLPVPVQALGNENRTGVGFPLGLLRAGRERSACPGSLAIDPLLLGFLHPNSIEKWGGKLQQCGEFQNLSRIGGGSWEFVGRRVLSVKLRQGRGSSCQAGSHLVPPSKGCSFLPSSLSLHLQVELGSFLGVLGWARTPLRQDWGASPLL